MKTSSGENNRPSIQHDTELYEQLATFLEVREPDVVRRSMFGSPALYIGRRMGVCVYGDGIGLRVPEDVATRAIDEGIAVPFQPYGKSRMREWVMLTGGVEAIEPNTDLLLTALEYARENNG